MAYNGWANYETWCVNLWLTNDQDTDEDTRRIACRATSDYAAADGLKDYVDELVDILGRPEGFIADLFGAALSEVDWLELAQIYRADCEGDEGEEEE